MLICRTVADVRARRAGLASPVGFVPTMGALHAGHVSLLDRARAECAHTIASVYVNPLQFGPGEDLGRYPRPFEADVATLESRGVDILFAPDDAVMYPDGATCTVDPGEIARHLEGERRPGHFRGVATVVAKLFNVISPDRAYFGSKDAQQVAVMRRLVADLHVPVTIVACPTIRESDGLALSSRNAYLSADERREAVRLSQALRAMVQAAQRGDGDAAAIVDAARAGLSPLTCDYLAIVDPGVFAPLRRLPPRSSLLAVGAAFCGATRLIDNMELQTP